MGLATLRNNTVMLPLVFRGFEEDFAPGVGATVNFRKPATFVAHDFVQSVGTTRQNITETYDSITLDHHKEVTIALTSADAALNLTDLQTQVVTPAIDALVASVDMAILSLRTDVTQEITAAAYNKTSNPNPTFDLIDAGRMLTTAKVPLTGRVAVVDEYIAAQWKRDELMNRADARGDAGTALREASVGRVHGMDIVETNNIDDFTGVAFHPYAFAFVARPLAPAMGGARAETLSRDGLSIRATYSWDPTYLTDVLTLDLLFGIKTLDPARAVLINGLSDSV
jgi:hypothetical protein